MEAELHKIKDIFVDNLKKVIERGEKFEDLQAKAGDLSIAAKTLKVKSKKLNRGFWDMFGCAGGGICAGNGDLSRGKIDIPGKL
jgi:hypothetical protein